MMLSNTRTPIGSLIYPKRLLDVAIPFSTEVEKMGVHRAPVATFARSGAAAKSYDALCQTVQKRL